MRKFYELYKNPTEGKECDNLVAIVGHLYNFQVVHSLLIFDILKLLVGAFTEKDVELILFVLRNVGFALRKDDALALKELISEGQRKASEMGSKFQDQNRVLPTITFDFNYLSFTRHSYLHDMFWCWLQHCVIDLSIMYQSMFSGAFHAGNHAGSEEQ